MMGNLGNLNNSSSNSTQMPDIASMMGPLLAGLTGGGGAGTNGMPDIVSMMASLNTEQNVEQKKDTKEQSSIEYMN